MRTAFVVTIALAGCGFTATKATSGDKLDAATADASSEPPPPIDAAVDAATDAPLDAPPVWTVVDTLQVPCTLGSVTSTFVLQMGVAYKLHATGECVTNTANNSRGDAEYLGYNIGPTLDSVSNVDSGIAVNDPTPGSTKDPRWGAFTTTHAYEVMWTGTGATIVAKFHSADYSNNAGSLALQILSLQ